jgi:hypothetical protein
MTVSRLAAGDLVPAMYLQRGLWRLLRDAGPGEGFAVRAVRITGPLDLDRLHAAAGTVRAALPALGVNLVDRGGELLLRGHGILALRTHDVSHVAPDRRDAACVEVLLAERDRPTDLAGEPLARFHVVRLAAEHTVLGLVAHELVLDDRSLYEVLGAVLDAYRGRFRPETYPDFTRFLAFYPLPGSVAANRRRWWSRWLSELPPHAAPAVPAWEGVRRRLIVDAAGWQKLATAGGGPPGEHGPLSVAALVAWWLRCAAGRPATACLATVLDLRDYADLGWAVGPLADRLVFRPDPARADPKPVAPSFRDALRAAQVGLLRAVTHYLPYGEVVDLAVELGRVSPERTAAWWDVHLHLCRGQATGDAGYELLNTWVARFCESDLVAAGPRRGSRSWDGTNVYLYLGAAGAQMAVIVDVRRDHPDFTADQLVDGLRQAIDVAVGDPDAPLPAP